MVRAEPHTNHTNAVFWGTGIVFFLAKFINLHNDITQGFWVELCQQVETGALKSPFEHTHTIRP